MAAALGKAEEGKTPDGRTLIGFTVPVCIVLLTLGLGYVAKTQSGVLDRIDAHLKPDSMGHETPSERDERIRDETRVEARNTNWDQWRSGQDVHKAEVKEFMLEQRAYIQEANPRAAAAAAIAVEAARNDP